MELLNLVEIQLERTLHQEAQSRRLAHRVQENDRQRALRESRRAWAEAGSTVQLLDKAMH